MEIKWNEEGLQGLAQHVGEQVAAKTQEVYDRVLRAGTGKSVQEVEDLLAHELESEFGAAPTSPDLTNIASELAAGRRVEARPGPAIGL